MCSVAERTQGKITVKRSRHPVCFFFCVRNNRKKPNEVCREGKTKERQQGKDPYLHEENGTVFCSSLGLRGREGSERNRFRNTANYQTFSTIESAYVSRKVLTYAAIINGQGREFGRL